MKLASSKARFGVQLANGAVAIALAGLAEQILNGKQRSEADTAMMCPFIASRA